MRQLDCWRVHVRKLEFEGLRAFPASTPTLDKVKAMVRDRADPKIFKDLERLQRLGILCYRKLDVLSLFSLFQQT